MALSHLTQSFHTLAQKLGLTLDNTEKCVYVSPAPGAPLSHSVARGICWKRRPGLTWSGFSMRDPNTITALPDVTRQGRIEMGEIPVVLYKDGPSVMSFPQAVLKWEQGWKTFEEMQAMSQEDRDRAGVREFPLKSIDVSREYKRELEASRARKPMTTNDLVSALRASAAGAGDDNTPPPTRRGRRAAQEADAD